MDTTTELDELVKLFSLWRANKKSRAERLPDELVKRARELRGGRFSDREICKRTGLNPYRLPPAKPKKPPPKSGITRDSPFLPFA